MVVAKCEKCGKEYQLEPNKKLSNFQCECGGELSPKEVVVEPLDTTKHIKQRKSWKERAEGVKSGEIELNELFVYGEKASRIELIVRIFYGIPVGILLILYGIIAGIFLVLQWIVILLLGRRSKTFNNFIKGYLEYNIHLMGYFALMTDKQPGISPKKVKIFEVIE
jgi:DNA-directed RNA polymerase subunit RPC12/RpoP